MPPRSSDSPNVSYEHLATQLDLREMEPPGPIDRTPSPPFSRIRPASGTSGLGLEVPASRAETMVSTAQAAKKGVKKEKEKLAVFKDKDDVFASTQTSVPRTVAEGGENTPGVVRVHPIPSEVAHATRSTSDSATRWTQRKVEQAAEAGEDQVTRRAALVRRLEAVCRERTELLRRLAQLDEQEREMLAQLAPGPSTADRRRDHKLVGLDGEKAVPRIRMVGSPAAPSTVASPARGDGFTEALRSTSALPLAVRSPVPGTRMATPPLPRFDSPALAHLKSSIPRRNGLVGAQAPRRVPLVGKPDETVHGEKMEDADQISETAAAGKAGKTPRRKTPHRHGDTAARGMGSSLVNRAGRQGQIVSADLNAPVGSGYETSTSVRVAVNFGGEQPKTTGEQYTVAHRAGTPKADSTRGSSRKLRTPKYTRRTPDWNVPQTVARKQWDF